MVTPKFVNMKQIMGLEMGSTLAEVKSELGSNPYDILSSQQFGYTIYVYKYKVSERKVKPKLVNLIGGETIGDEVYNGKLKNLYLFFKFNKLETIVSGEGRNSSAEMELLNNTLYVLAKDKEKHFVVPEDWKEKEPAGK